MIRKYSFTNNSGAGAVGLRVMFLRSATPIVWYHGLALSDGTVLGDVEVEVNPYGADLRWTPTLPQGAEVVLSVEPLNNELTPGLVLWLGENGAWSDPGRPLTAEELSFRNAASVWEFARRTARDDADRGCVLLAMNPRFRRCYEFFCELEVFSHQDLQYMISKSPVTTFTHIKSVQALKDHLGERILARRDAARENAGTPFTAELPETLMDQVAGISTRMLGMYGRHFRAPQGGIDLDAVHEAFELFANGELHFANKMWNVWDCAPNGALLFGFAEFAFMAIDADIDGTGWEELLAPLVAAQPIYMRAYQPAGTPPFSWENYTPPVLVAANQLSDDDKQAVRAEYVAIKGNPGQLRLAAGRNALAAFGK